MNPIQTPDLNGPLMVSWRLNYHDNHATRSIDLRQQKTAPTRSLSFFVSFVIPHMPDWSSPGFSHSLWTLESVSSVHWADGILSYISFFTVLFSSVYSCLASPSHVSFFHTGCNCVKSSPRASPVQRNTMRVWYMFANWNSWFVIKLQEIMENLVVAQSVDSGVIPKWGCWQDVWLKEVA